MTSKDINEHLKLLKGDNSALKLFAIEEISKHPDRDSAIDQIINTLYDTDPDVRTYAAEILGDIRQEKAFLPLKEHLTDTSWKVREACVTSLAKFHDNEILGELIARLNDDSQNVRYTTAKILSDFTEPDVVLPLFRALKDESETVVEEARRSLLSFQGMIDNSLIIPLLNDENALVRKTAVQLIRLAVKNNHFELYKRAMSDRDSKIRLEVVKELEKFGWKNNENQFIDVNIHALKDEDLEVKIQACENLSNVPDERVIQPLISCSTEDEDDRVRLKAIDALTTVRRVLRLN